MQREYKYCPICKKTDYSILQELPNYPLTELFEKKSSKQNFLITEASQSFCFCEDCNHGFLKNIIDPSYLYQKDNYNTVSSNSRGALISLKNFSDFINKSKNFNNKFVIDIGGNDSNLLDSVKAHKGVVIDPNCKTQNPNYKALNCFFEQVDPLDIKSKNAAVVSSHTLEHIENPDTFFNFLAGIENAQSIFLQFPSLELMIESSRLDMIHHQHIHYYSLESIQRIANKYNLNILRFEYDYDHYGTLRVELSKDKISNKFSSYKKYNPSFLKELFKKFNKFIEAQDSFLDQLDNIYCYGASLMLPITFYYYPNLKKSKGILDSDASKSLVKYANIDTEILPDSKEINLENKTIFITANATRFANRIILKNLVDRNPQYIINPYSTF